MLTVEVAAAISWPGSLEPTLVAPAPTLPPPPPSPRAPLESPAPTTTGPTAPLPPVHKAYVRPERDAVRPAEPAANPETSESVKRGVVPAGSREAYPQK